MALETVQSIEIESFDSFLLVKLEGGGEPWYQTVNYTTTEIEWHNNLGVFRIDMKDRKTCIQWFSNILEILENEIDVQLKLNGATAWTNIPNEVKGEIELAAIRPRSVIARRSAN